MRKTHLFNVVIATTSIATAIPLTTSCTFVSKTPRLNTITLSLPFEDLCIEENKNFESDTISVECLDQFGKIFETQTELVLKTTDNLDPPDWIKLDQEKKTLLITGNIPPSIYNFSIFAQDILTKSIRSDILNFSVEIYKTPLLPPDYIEITCDKTEHTVCYSNKGNIQLDLIALKEEYPQDLISKKCHWSITNVTGPYHDESLFYIEGSEENAHLFVNTDIDESFVGIYDVTIQAKSVLEPYATDDIILKINIVNGFNYYDATTKYTYTRESLDQPWSLSYADSGVSIIKDVITEKYGYPVTSVGKDFCSKSGIRVSSVILPESIIKIEDNAFANQSILYTVAMPKVRYIGKNAFSDCIHMYLSKKYDLPKFEQVEEKAFYNCSSFVLNSENHFQSIGSYAFYNTAIEKINIGNRINVIGNNSFGNCSKLTEITLNVSNPPEIVGVLYSGTTNPQFIKVPMISVENYQKNSFWQPYKSKIVGF